MPNSLMSVVYENFGCSSSPSSCLLYAPVTRSSHGGSPSIRCEGSSLFTQHELDGRVQPKTLDTVFIVDDLVALYERFSLCGFELPCSALDNLPLGSHLEFPFGGVFTNDKFFYFSISGHLIFFSVSVFKFIDSFSPVHLLLKVFYLFLFFHTLGILSKAACMLSKCSALACGPGLQFILLQIVSLARPWPAVSVSILLQIVSLARP